MDFNNGLLFSSMLEFIARIGNASGVKDCSAPTSRNEGVIVESSTDNGITWNVLQVQVSEVLGPMLSDINAIFHDQFYVLNCFSFTRYWSPIY